MDDDCKYALVIQDFHTGNPIDLLRSRRTSVTEPYFISIPATERNHVKYLISDMYNPYIAYVEKYFPNAVPVVDSFHVIQWITRSIDNYIRQLLKNTGSATVNIRTSFPMNSNDLFHFRHQTKYTFCKIQMVNSVQSVQHPVPQ